MTAISKKLFVAFFFVLGLLAVPSALAYDSPVSEKFFFRFNDTDSTVTDFSGNGRTGDIIGSVSTGASGISRSEGEWDSGLAFDFQGSGRYDSGTDGDVKVTGLPVSDSTFSVSMWYNADTACDASSASGDYYNNGLFAYHDESFDHTSGNQRFNLVADGDADQQSGGSVSCEISVWDSNNGFTYTGEQLNTNEWVHIVLTFDSGSTTVYMNGSSVSTMSRGSLPSSLDALNIGGNPDGASEQFDGRIDEPRFFSKQLNSTEVSNLYQYNQITSVSGNSAPSLSNPSPSDGASDISTTTDLSIDYSDLDGDSGTVNFYWENGTQIYQESSVSSGTTVTTQGLNLDLGTTYNWYVEADDGNTTSSAGNYSFTTESLTGSVDPCAGSVFGCWFFNESSSPLVDYSGNNYDGTWNGGLTSGVTGISKSEGDWNDNLAYSLDGSDDYVALPDMGSYSSITQSVWIKPAYLPGNNPDGENFEGIIDADNDEAIIYYSATGDNCNPSIQFQLDNTGFNSEGGSCVPDSEITVDEWTHIVQTYNSSSGNWSVYLDGELWDSTTASLGSIDVNGHWFGQGDSTDGYHWGGDIDEVKMFDEYSTPTEVSNLYQYNSINEPTTDYSPKITSVDPADNTEGVDDTVDGTPIDVNLSIVPTDINTDTLEVDFYESDGTLIESFSSVANNTEVETVWEDLNQNTQYEWYVNVSDGENHTVGGNYSFTTKSLAPSFDRFTPDNQSSGVNNTESGIGIDVDLGSYVTDSDSSTIDSVEMHWRGNTVEDIFSNSLIDSFSSVSNNTAVNSTASDLDYAQRYYWKVNGTDGTYSDSEDLFFDTASGDYKQVDRSPDTGSHQGVAYGEDASGEKFVYTFDTNHIYKRDADGYSLVDENTDPISSFPSGVDHLGDGQIYKGYIYIAVEDWNGCGTSDQYRIARFNATDLSFVDEYTTPDHEVSGIAINEQDNRLYVSDYCDFDQPVNEYYLDNFTKIGGISTSQSVENVQATAYKDSTLSLVSDGGSQDGKIYRSTLDGDIIGYFVNADSSPANEGIAWKGDNLLQILDYGSGEQDVFEWSKSDADNTPPTSTDNWTASGFVDKSSVDVMISATDSGSGVANITYSINGGTETTVSGSSTTVTISNPGNNSLSYYATDNDGNVEASNTEYLALDAENPLVEFNPSTTEGEVDQDFITVNVSASDSVSGLSSVTENFNGTKTSLTENNNGYYINNHTGLSEGLYEFNVTAEDLAGNQKTTVTKSATVNLTNRPSAGLTLNASVVEIGEVFQADGSCSDSDGTCESIEYDWDGDGVYDASGDTAVHSYGSPGEKTVSVRVTDNEGLTDTASENISVDTNDAPSASFTASTSDLGVSVDASGSSDVDGSIVSYSWDWTNDGSFEANGETASHSYSSGGDYTVKLKIEDDDKATDTATKTVSVSSSSDDGDDGGGGGGGGGDTSNPPTVSISNPNGTVFGLKNIDLNYTVSDADSCEYSVNNGQRKKLANCSNTEFNVSGIGDHQVTVYASNSDGETFEVREFETDLKNQIRLNSSKTGSVENFSIDFAGLESETDNGVIQFNSSQLSTGNNTLTVNSEGLKPVTENFTVDKTFTVNKTYVSRPVGIDLAVFDESNPSNQFNSINLSVSKGSDIQNVKETDDKGGYAVINKNSDDFEVYINKSIDSTSVLHESLKFRVFDPSPGNSDASPEATIKVQLNYKDKEKVNHTVLDDGNVPDGLDDTERIDLNKTSEIEKIIVYGKIGDHLSDDVPAIEDFTFVDDSFRNKAELNDTYNVWKQKNFPTGEIKLEISKNGYKTRTYKTNFAGDTDSSIKGFLLENSKGVFVETEAIGSSGNLLPDTQFTLKRVLGNELETLSQLNASTQGSAAFFTNPDSRYTLEATHPEFKDGSAVFSPSNYRTDPLRITLAETLEKTTLDVAPLFSGTCKSNTTRIECSYDGQVDRMDKAILDVEEYGVAVNETICRQENTSTEGTLTCTGLNTSEKRYKFLLTGKYGSAVTQADAGVLGTKDSPVPLTGLFMTAIIFMIVTSATAFDLRIGIGAGTTTLILANMIDWITLTPTQNATLIAVAIIAGVAVQKQ